MRKYIGGPPASTDETKLETYYKGVQFVPTDSYRQMTVKGIKFVETENFLRF
jgi:hypothetical protein